MTQRRTLAVLLLPAVMAASGCLASKGDIRLLQEEVRASRSASANSDAAQRAQADSLARASDRATAAAFTRIDAAIRAQADTIRALRRLVDANQINEHDFQLKVTDWQRDMTQQMGTVRALAETFPSIGKNMKATLEAYQAQIDSLRRLVPGGGIAMPAAGIPDSMSSAAPSAVAPGTPGPATLQQQGLLSLNQQSYSSARRSFQLLIDSYPSDDLVPETYMYIGRAYAEERNTTAADSVYQLVATRFPRSSVAGTAIYRRAVLIESKNPTLAHTLYLQVVKQYPNSESYPLACAKVRTAC